MAESKTPAKKATKAPSAKKTTSAKKTAAKPAAKKTASSAEKSSTATPAKKTQGTKAQVKKAASAGGKATAAKNAKAKASTTTEKLQAKGKEAQARVAAAEATTSTKSATPGLGMPDASEVREAMATASQELKKNTDRLIASTQEATETLKTNVEEFRNELRGQYETNRRRGPVTALVRTPQYVAVKAFEAGRGAAVLATRTASAGASRLLKR